jgi:hypothetical protein
MEPRVPRACTSFQMKIARVACVPGARPQFLGRAAGGDVTDSSQFIDRCSVARRGQFRPRKRTVVVCGEHDLEIRSAVERVTSDGADRVAHRFLLRRVGETDVDGSHQPSQSAPACAGNSPAYPHPRQAVLAARAWRRRLHGGGGGGGAEPRGALVHQTDCRHRHPEWRSPPCCGCAASA